jgi:hypothetical protein
MGKLIPLSRGRASHGALDIVESSAAADVDKGLAPVVVLLFVASVARVLRAWWCHEAFDTEPTLALAFVIGLPWLAFRWRKKPA